MKYIVRKNNLPPRPEVQFLPTLFRRLQVGEIRIPAFQRGLVWSNEEIRALLESVYLGYPIGSLLMWSTNAMTFRAHELENIQLPMTLEKEGEKSVYVLDGMQRLITLYATFNGGGGPEKQFDLSFDLANQRFLHSPPTLIENMKDVSPRLQLSRVFSPRQFIEDQSELAKLPSADRWLECAVDLHSRFQEYALPIVTIQDATTEEAVTIFTNINRSGLSLSTIDFMRALTWHDVFDLNSAIDRILESLPSSFSPTDETIAKTIALNLNIDPLPDAILALRTKSVSELNSAVETTGRSLLAACEFLKRTFGALSADFVPYEGQLLLIVVVCGSSKYSSSFDKMLLKWFIYSSFSESLQGRPDHAIVKMIKHAKEEVEESRFLLDAPELITSANLTRKNLRKGTAVSCGFIALLSIADARSLTTGEIIEKAEYLAEFDANKLCPIFVRSKFPEIPSDSRRQLMNLVIVSSAESAKVRNFEILSGLLSNASTEILASQLLDSKCVELILSGQYQKFIEHRSIIIRQKIHRLFDE